MTGSITVATSEHRPGDFIRGEVSWTGAPEKAELRLFWRTQGKGTTDVQTVETVIFESPGPDERRVFGMEAPKFPCSFSGKLISLIWELELVIDGKGAATAEVVISPSGYELDLQRPEWIEAELADELPRWMWWKK